MLRYDSIYDSINIKVVIDTNVLVTALLGEGNAGRAVLELAFDGELLPLVSNTLFCEYEDLMNRDQPFERQGCVFSREQRNLFLDDWLSICKWVDIHYLWRPNLRDEGDNHVMELAVAGQAEAILTYNKRDFRGGDLMMPETVIIDPAAFLSGRRAYAWRH